MSKANEVYNNSPQTTEQALTKAKTALQIVGDNTFTVEEIDSYLPDALKKGDNN